MQERRPDFEILENYIVLVEEKIGDNEKSRFTLIANGLIGRERWALLTELAFLHTSYIENESDYQVARDVSIKLLNKLGDSQYDASREGRESNLYEHFNSLKEMAFLLGLFEYSANENLLLTHFDHLMNSVRKGLLTAAAAQSEMSRLWRIANPDADHEFLVEAVDTNCISIREPYSPTLELGPDVFDFETGLGPDERKIVYDPIMPQNVTHITSGLEVRRRFGTPYLQSDRRPDHVGYIDENNKFIPVYTIIPSTHPARKSLSSYNPAAQD